MMDCNNVVIFGRKAKPLNNTLAEEKMSFAEAYREMRKGKAIAHETFDGDVWVWENDTIMLHSFSGMNYRFQDAPDIGRLFDLIVEDKWSVVEDQDEDE